MHGRRRSGSLWTFFGEFGLVCLFVFERCAVLQHKTQELSDEHVTVRLVILPPEHVKLPEELERRLAKAGNTFGPLDF